METRRLIRELSRPEAYPDRAEHVEVRQTHISIVFLAGEFVYKLKKPLDLGFLDFTTLERRLHFCREEVRLNRRLAPDVYLGVVPVTDGPDGLRIGGEGDAAEWAVRMRRLPDEATLRELLLRDALEAQVVEALGHRIADFHARARGGPEVARYGRFETVAENARDNLVQARDHVGVTIHSHVLGRLEDVLEERLAELRPIIDERAGRGVPRDTHGDLHLDHVYLFPDRDPPSDLVVIDCVEFSERFRYADPVSDMAFFAMDLIYHGRPDLEERFSEAYFEASGDRDGGALLPFYRSYRAAVRGKVDGMAAMEEEVGSDERDAAARSARAHWLLALAELDSPSRRPGLLLVGGLPGSGKSTVAEGLARRADFRIVSSDRTRKALAGLEPETSAATAFQEGIYTEEWTARTYEACLQEAGEALTRGERVLVDATFREEQKRRMFLSEARRLGVPALLLVCRAEPETIRKRMPSRSGGASDADWEVYRQLASRWEEFSASTRRFAAEVDTEGDPETSVRTALEHVQAVALAE